MPIDIASHNVTHRKTASKTDAHANNLHKQHNMQFTANTPSVGQQIHQYNVT